MMGQRTTGLITIAAVLIGLLLGFALLRTPALGQASLFAPSSPASQPPSVGVDGSFNHTISVTGSGQMQAKPDVAFVTIGVENQATIASQAQQDNASKMAAVVAAIKKQGIPDSDIQTSALSLQPVYNNQGQPAGQGPQIAGYRAINSVTVKVIKISQAGSILDEAVKAGANTEGSIRFAIANDTALRQQALKNAVQDARGKADAIASQLSVRITGVHLASEGSFSVPVVRQPFQAAAPSAAAATPVEPGEMTITAQVQVLYDY